MFAEDGIIDLFSKNKETLFTTEEVRTLLDLPQTTVNKWLNKLWRREMLRKFVSWHIEDRNTKKRLFAHSDLEIIGRRGFKIVFEVMTDGSLQKL